MFNRPFSTVYRMLDQVFQVQPFGFAAAAFYRLDALPVIQSTASEHLSGCYSIWSLLLIHQILLPKLTLSKNHCQYKISRSKCSPFLEEGRVISFYLHIAIVTYQPMSSYSSGVTFGLV